MKTGGRQIGESFKGFAAVLSEYLSERYYVLAVIKLKPAFSYRVHVGWFASYPGHNITELFLGANTSAAVAYYRDQTVSYKQKLERLRASRIEAYLVQSELSTPDSSDPANQYNQTQQPNMPAGEIMPHGNDPGVIGDPPIADAPELDYARESLQGDYNPDCLK